MGKKSRKRSTTGKKAPTVLKENLSAVARHTKELNRNSAALAAHTAILSHVSAKQLVYSVLQEPLTLPEKTKLSALGLDFLALAGTAARIRARGVKVDTGLVQACTTVGDLVKVVAAAMH
jgi:aryl carrier-like protein